MSGLMISLRPNEKFLVNGALLSNGPKRGQICVEGDDVNILRLCDALHPNEVNSPVSRLYYRVQTVLSGDSNVENSDQGIRNDLKSLIHVFENTPLCKALSAALTAWESGRIYSTLCRLKPLLSVEAELLNYAPASPILEVAE
jgi:flagellar protein FlbT